MTGDWNGLTAYLFLVGCRAENQMLNEISD